MTQFTGPTDERIPIVERWRAIPGIRNYECSNTGKIRNVETGTVLKETDGMVNILKSGARNYIQMKALDLLDRAWGRP